MNFFSKLFSPSKPTVLSPDKSKHIQHLRKLFEPPASLYTQVPLFNNQSQHLIPYMMIHPNEGILLFNFFEYSAGELKGVTAKAADAQDTDADIQTDSRKNFIMQRFDEIFHTQLAPVRSLLICSNLSEQEFQDLHQSFHTLIPNDATLFTDSDDKRYKEVIHSNNKPYEIEKIKRALFAELVIPKTRSLMNIQQERIIHAELEENSLYYGLPGTGKSSMLIIKALYEKMKNRDLNLIIMGKRSCSVHHLQALIFAFIENSHWGINPAEVLVSSFETIKKRCSEKEKFDLIICDDINAQDLDSLLQLLHKDGKLLASSHYQIPELKTYNLEMNYRLSPALCAACEGLGVENLKHSLEVLHGNINMNLILTLKNILKDSNPTDVLLIHQNKEELLKLQAELDDYFTPISYLFDDEEKIEGIGLYPLSHLPCLLNKYLIIVIEDDSEYDPIELISRASKKTFILSQSEAVYNVVDLIKNKLSGSVS